MVCYGLIQANKDRDNGFARVGLDDDNRISLISLLVTYIYVHPFAPTSYCRGHINKA
jgi:hypothetical protein